MSKLTQCAVIDPVLQTTVDAYVVTERPEKWKKKPKPVPAFLKAIMTQGIAIQKDRCIWCTLPFGAIGRRTIHRDHIAPSSEHPEWTFLAKNLALSCEYCNGFAVKKALNTIRIKRAQYERCKFHIVHPYLDIVSNHIQFDGDAIALPVIIKGITRKGRWTIKNIQLDTPEMTTLRAKEAFYANRHKYRLAQPEEDLVQAALGAI